MKTQTLHMNVYRAGFYHRQGKPGHCNIHAGDFFTSWAAAIAAVERDKGYIATVAFEMPVPEGTTILANPDGSVPTPLSATRGNPFALIPWHTAPEVLPPVLTAGLLCPTQKAAYVDDESLDTSEAEAVDPTRVMRQQQQTAANYRPAHGGYPGVVMGAPGFGSANTTPPLPRFATLPGDDSCGLGGDEG